MFGRFYAPRLAAESAKSCVSLQFGARQTGKNTRAIPWWML
jgi:hypothetical protein